MYALVTQPDHPAPVLTEVETPAVGPGDLRIAVAATAVNPVDLLFTGPDGRGMFGLPDRVGLGWDASGTVLEVGGEVTGFAVGDRVAALDVALAAGSRTHAEQLVVPATSAAHVPAGLDLVDAGSVPLNGLAARQAIDLLGPADGRSLLVTGAAGAVGGYAVALAAREGWRVTGLVRAGDDVDFVRRTGADVLTEAPGPDFDAVFDAATIQDAALAFVRDGGTFVGTLSLLQVTAERDITVTAVATHPDGAALATLLDLSAAGVLEVRVAGRVPLTDAATAYDKVAGGGQRGRWLLLP